MDIFGKKTVLKQCDLKTAEWNKFYGAFLNEVWALTIFQIKNTLLDEVKKYERKAYDIKMVKNLSGKGQVRKILKLIRVQSI